MSMTSLDLHCHSSNFTQKSSKPSIVLYKYPTISSTLEIICSTNLRFLVFSVLDFPTIIPRHLSSSPQGFFILLSATTICKEDICMSPSFLLMVGIKHGVYHEKMAKIFIWGINVSFSFLMKSYPNTTFKSFIGTMEKLVFPHQSPKFNKISLATQTTLSTPALIILKFVCIGLG
jgi:hypothetical protein